MDGRQCEVGTPRVVRPGVGLGAGAGTHAVRRSPGTPGGSPAVRPVAYYGGVTPRRLYESTPPARRCRALFVLALLAGLLGMHALSPVITSAPSLHEHRHGHRMAVAAGAHAHCGGEGGCDSGGHVHHADTTCASGALDGPPTPPSLVPSPLRPAEPEDATGAGESKGQDGGRAPPSLAELQLLRI